MTEFTPSDTPTCEPGCACGDPTLCGTVDPGLLAVCPKCGALVEDLDGFGVLAHDACGYCSHPDIYGGRCQICSMFVGEFTPSDTSSFREHIDRWLTSNEKTPEQVRWGNFPLGMVGGWIERAKEAETERDGLRLALERVAAWPPHDGMVGLCESARAALEQSDV